CRAWGAERARDSGTLSCVEAGELVGHVAVPAGDEIAALGGDDGPRGVPAALRVFAACADDDGLGVAGGDLAAQPANPFLPAHGYHTLGALSAPTSRSFWRSALCCTTSSLTRFFVYAMPSGVRRLASLHFDWD